MSRAAVDEAKAEYEAERNRHNNTVFGDRKSHWDSWDRVSDALRVYHRLLRDYWRQQSLLK